jgi:hypothetical protein
MIQNKLLHVIQFQFPYVHISTHYNIQSITVIQQNTQPAKHQLATRQCNLCVENVSET